MEITCTEIMELHAFCDIVLVKVQGDKAEFTRSFEFRPTNVYFHWLAGKNIPKCPMPCRDNEIAYVFSYYEVLICTQTLIYTHKHTSYVDNTGEVINWLNGSETKYFNAGPILSRSWDIADMQRNSKKVDDCVKQLRFVIRYRAKFEYELLRSVPNRLIRSTVN